jgi:hypothetical protein
MTLDGRRKVRDETIIFLLEQGWTITQIAKHCNVTTSCISKRVKRLRQKAVKAKGEELKRLKAVQSKVQKKPKKKPENRQLAQRKRERERLVKDHAAIEEAREEIRQISAEVVTAKSAGDTLDVRAVFERLMSSLNNSLDFLEESEIVATDLERPGLLKQKLTVISETRQLVGTIANLYQTIMFQKEYERFCESVYEVLNDDELFTAETRERVIRRLHRKALGIGAS